MSSGVVVARFAPSVTVAGTTVLDKEHLQVPCQTTLLLIVGEAVQPIVQFPQPGRRSIQLHAGEK